MSRQRLIAFIAGLAAVVGLALFVPMVSSASAATCAAAWNSSSVYTGGMSASYNGHNWTANQWNYNEAPGGSSGAWNDDGAC